MKKNLVKRTKVHQDRKDAKKERIYMHLECNPAKSHEEIMEETNQFRKRLGFEPIPV